MIDLRTAAVVHLRRGVIKSRQQISLVISCLCGVLVNTVKNILQMAGIAFQESALYNLSGEVVSHNMGERAF